MDLTSIAIHGAREHFLKDVSLELPRNQLIVFTGVSGSGKSSLAIDTLYREGKRRYFEFLSGELPNIHVDFPRPDVDSIEGLPPVLLIGRSGQFVNSRSTVGTLLEIQDLLRLLFSKAGDIFCHHCLKPVYRFTPHQIVEEVFKKHENTAFLMLSPLPSKASIDWIRKEGFIRLRINGKLVPLEEVNTLQEKEVEIVIDRLRLDRNERSRITDSIELALRYGGGTCKITYPDLKEELIFSTEYRCFTCNINLGEMATGAFSFNSPYGACERCQGGGLNVNGALCSVCKGARIKPEALSVKIGSINIFEIGELSIQDAWVFFKELKFHDVKRQEIAREILEKICRRLEFLTDSRLAYLNLNRRAETLSSGEFQRVRMAAQMASRLTGVLYMMDEPTLGLHPCEIQRLIQMLQNLKELGNTVVVIEHDEDVIRACDWVVEMGPGAGPRGGHVQVCGSLREIIKKKESLTSALLRGMESSVREPKRLDVSGFPLLEIRGVRINNLKNVHVKIPLGSFCCVTGVSGSGKSSLVEEALYMAFIQKKKGIIHKKGLWKEIKGFEQIKDIVKVDSDWVGGTARSNVATYLGIFDVIRELFSKVPESRVRAYNAGRFSHNVKGGRCEACLGQGVQDIKMEYLSDIEIPCEVCRGTRFNPETLEVKYKGLNIAQILEMTTGEAKKFFEAIPSILERLNNACQMGLDYLPLGQSSRSLSGGEAQRLKLAEHLSRRSRGCVLYIFDEPTRGLHTTDIQKLLNVFFKLRDAGHTLLVIEHHLSLIWRSDYVIDLGPGAGEEGGNIVAEGTPEEVARNERSITGKYLKRFTKEGIIDFT